MEKRDHFYEIDLLRFFAAISVIAYHYTFQGFTANNVPVEYAIFAPVSRYGYLGVNLFFIISGFVILNSASKKSAKGFLISRIVRLYPAFWISCSLTFAAMLIMGGNKFHASLVQYAANMTALGGHFGYDHIDNVYWTLFFEVRFYLMVFILLILGKMDSIKYFLGLWLALSLLFFAIHQRQFDSLLMVEYSGYFIAGAVFFLVNYEGLDFYKLFLLLGSYSLVLLNSTKYIKKVYPANYESLFHFPVIAVCITVFFLIFYLVSTNRTKWIGSRRFIALGLMTYPLYLLHQDIGFILFNVSYPYLNKYALLLIIFSFMLLLSYVVSSKVEKALSRHLKKLLEELFDIFGSYISAACGWLKNQEGKFNQKLPFLNVLRILLIYSLYVLRLRK